MQSNEVLSMAGMRADGRRFDELRRMRHRFGSCKNNVMTENEAGLAGISLCPYALSSIICILLHFNVTL